ncbi:hypothetical protein ABH917_000927 [Thermobifida halotolerans]
MPQATARPTPPPRRASRVRPYVLRFLAEVQP